MSSKLRIRALILAAGYGSRLKPLSIFLPKPLLPISNRPIVESTLRQVAKVDCEKIFFNLHHLGEKIRGCFGDFYKDIPLGYSVEKTIQGTAGALFPLKDELSKADIILLVNGDTFCKWPWQRMIESHVTAQADVTLLLHNRMPDKAIGGGVGVDSHGRIVQFRAERPVGEIARRHLFAGAHILSPRMLNLISEGPGDIISTLYVPFLKSGGTIGSVVTARQWHDLGTPERYLEANLDRVRSRNLGISVVSPTARVDAPDTVRRSVIGSGAIVEAGARIDASVLLQNTHVPEASVLKHVIVGPGVSLPAGEFEHQMITRNPDEDEPKGRYLGHGGLVYTPLRGF